LLEEMPVQETALASQTTRVTQQSSAVVVAELAIRFEPNGNGGERPVRHRLNLIDSWKAPWSLGPGPNLFQKGSCGGEAAEVTVEFELGESCDPSQVGRGVRLNRLPDPLKIRDGPGRQLDERQIVEIAP